MEQLIINAIKNYGIEKAMGMFAKDDVDEAIEKMTGGGLNNSFINKFTGGQGLTGLFKNQAKKFGVNQGLKALTSGSGSGIAGALPLFGAALGLGYLTNPLRPGSYNYNPELQGQIDYASGRGYIDRNNSMNALQYNKNSILSGQNVVSGFGTNDYAKQLQNHIDKYGDKDGKGQAELEDLTTDEFDKVDAFMEKQTTNNNGGGGSNNYGSFGKVDTGSFEQDGTGRQGYNRGGIASL